MNGATVTLAKIFESVPYLVLGRMLSLEAAALYNRSVTVAQLPDKLLLSGLAQILLPAFAADLRNGGNLRENYLRGIELITGLQWPVLVCLSLLAHPIVLLLLGDQWMSAALAGAGYGLGVACCLLQRVSAAHADGCGRSPRFACSGAHYMASVSGGRHCSIIA